MKPLIIPDIPKVFINIRDFSPKSFLDKAENFFLDSVLDTE